MSPTKTNNNTPIYLRTHISENIRQKNPEYKQLFLRCPKCNKFSFKPHPPVNDPIELGKVKRRYCNLCGYYNNALLKGLKVDGNK